MNFRWRQLKVRAQYADPYSEWEILLTVQPGLAQFGSLAWLGLEMWEQIVLLFRTGALPFLVMRLYTFLLLYVCKPPCERACVRCDLCFKVPQRDRQPLAGF